jgi:hypothetical protein
MKSLSLTFVCCCLYALSCAQELSNQHVKIGNRTLFGFAVSNMAVSGALLASNSNHADFHTTNLAWNSINAVIGVFAIASEKQFAGKVSADKKKFLLQTEKAYLFNTALDVSYIVAGLWIRNTSIEGMDSKSMGNAIIYNGSFLLLYDAVMSHVAGKYNNKWLYPTLTSNIGHHQFGVRIIF